MKYLLVFLMSFSPIAFSGGFVEPYLGISGLGKLSDSVVNPGSMDSFPVTVGARLGLVKLGLGVALDYATTRKMKFDNITDKGDLQELGLIVGYSFPILAKVYAGYIFTGGMELGAVEYKSLRGVKLGASFKPLPLLSVNLEMKKYDFNKFSGGIAGTSLNDADINAWLLSVSAPLNFF